MGRIFEDVVRYFRENNLSFRIVEGKTILYTGFNCRNVNPRCVVKAYEDVEILVFYSFLPFTVYQDKLTVLSEFLTRANYGLMIGNFEMDLADGEIRYKTSLCARNVELSSDHIHHLIHFNLDTMDRYAPGILQLLEGNMIANDVSRQFAEPVPSAVGHLPACKSPLITPCRYHQEGSCTGNYQETSMPLADGTRLPCPHRQAPRNIALGENSLGTNEPMPRLLTIMEPDTFALFDAILQQENYQCDNVPTLEEAIERVTSQGPYDLILMLGDKSADPNRMSWPSFVQYVKKLNLKTPMLLMSHDEQSLKDALASGCDAVVNVPFVIKKFFENVTRMVYKDIQK